MCTYIFVVDNAYKDDANLNDLLCKLDSSLNKSEIPVGNLTFCFHPVDNDEYTLDLEEYYPKVAYVFYHANIKLYIGNRDQACVYEFPFNHSRDDFIYTTLTEIIDMLINIRKLSEIEEKLSKLRKFTSYAKLPYYLFIKGLKHYLDQNRIDEAKELITEDKLKLIKNEELREDIQRLKDVDLTKKKNKKPINDLIVKLDRVLNNLNEELFGEP